MKHYFKLEWAIPFIMLFNRAMPMRLRRIFLVCIFPYTIMAICAVFLTQNLLIPYVLADKKSNHAIVKKNAAILKSIS